MGVGQDPLNFLVMDGTFCGLCHGNGKLPSDTPSAVLAEAGRIAMRGATHSRYRRLARARVLKHFMVAHRELAERWYPDWVAAHTDQTTSVAVPTRVLSL